MKIVTPAAIAEPKRKRKQKIELEVAGGTETEGIVIAQQRLSTVLKVQIRNLYMVDGMSPAQIGQRVGVKPGVVSGLVRHNGWSVSRKKMESNFSTETLVRAEEKLDEVSRAIANQSEEIALLGLQRARDAAIEHGEYAAKDFQSWTGGIRNLVTVSRACRGLEAAGGGAVNPSVNFFAVRGEKPALNV